MRTFPRLCLFAAMLLALTACAPGSALQNKAAQEKYGEVVDDFEGHYGYDAITQDDLYFVCASYLNLRDYKNYGICAEHLHDRQDTLGSGFMMSYLYRTYSQFILGEYQALAGIYVDTGQYDKALAYAKESLRIYRETCPGDYGVLGLIPALGWVGHIYALMGDRENAEVYLKEIEVQEDKLGMASGPTERTKGIWIAKIRIALKDYDKALEAIQKADLNGHGSNQNLGMAVAGVGVAAVELVFNPIMGAFDMATQLGAVAAGSEASHLLDNFEANKVIFWKGKCAFETGKYDMARTSYDQLLQDPNVVNYANLYPTLLHDRGSIALHDGDEKLAEEYYVKSINALESYRSKVVDDTSKIGFVSDKLAVYGDMVALLMRQQRYDEAFTYAERAKARALVDMLASREQFKARDKSGDMVAQLDDAELEAATLQTPEESAAKRSLFMNSKEAIKTKSPELASLVTVEAPDAAKLEKFLPEGETLVEYYGNHDKLYAFVMTSDGIDAAELDGKGLIEDVEAFRHALTDPRTKAYQKPGRALYKRLIAPLEKRFKGKDLTIVPHGPLHYLPFAALTKGHEFLVDEYAIRILPSASVMEYLKNRDDLPDSLLAFGNPDLGDPSLDLPGAQREVVSISGEIKGATVLLRDKATKDVLEERGAQFKYLHFATHGSYNPDKPLDSALFLAGSSPTAGMLTVDELYDIPLNADLVTLSACETGLGKVSNGDDVVGLSRGFLFAGASTIVSSLWQVDDEATALLMENMYGHLGKTDKRDALRDAQLYVKKHYKQHPYYWAAFELTGNS